MTITMTSKNQITIPKAVVKRMGFKKGSIFNIKIENNKIELIPMELSEKEFTDEELNKMEMLYQKEKGSAKRITKAFIRNL